MIVNNKGQGDTEQRILQIIAKHVLEHPSKKLGKAALAAEVGITRQALHRYYSHLNPYITGEKSANDLLGEVEKDAVFSKSINRINELEAELESLKAGMEKEISLIKSEYITSLMKSDLALHDADGLRARLESQSLHNGILINKIKSLEAELTAVKLDNIEGIEQENLGLNRLTIFDINLKKIFEKYQVHGDKSILDGDKVKAVQDAITSAKKSEILKDAVFVFFIDRYICSFDGFCKNFKEQRSGVFVVIRTPIFSALQLKTLIFSKLDSELKVKIFIPYCETASVAKAQRAFYFSNVPNYEVALADKLPILTIPDQRVNEVVFYQVKQGQ